MESFSIWTFPATVTSIGLASETCLGGYRFFNSLVVFVSTLHHFDCARMQPELLLHMLLHLSCALLSPLTNSWELREKNLPSPFTGLCGHGGSSSTDIASCYLAKSCQLHQAVVPSIQYLLLVSAYLMMQCCDHVHADDEAPAFQPRPTRCTRTWLLLEAQVSRTKKCLHLLGGRMSVTHRPRQRQVLGDRSRLSN